jgi:UDP-N-acetylglucosamine acyltransferase
VSTPPDGGGVDPRAIVEPGAVIGEGASVGAFSVIGAGAVVGARSRIGTHVVIEGGTSLGEECVVHPFTTLGGPPQDLKYKGEATRLTIGARNVFRESCTANRGTALGGGETRIGDGNLFMAGSHVAHDCRVGNGTIFANAATLAGHVTVEDGATIGAFSGVHQFCRIGELAFIGGYSVITQDALPYALTVGNRAESHGINVIGLRRRKFAPEVIEALRRAYRTLFRSKLPLKEALATLEASHGGVPEVAKLLEFVRTSERGVIR